MKYRAAFCYDFDGTLAEGNIQENSFIPEIGMTKDVFWKEVQKIRREQDADQILVYMNLMLEKAKEKGISVTHGELARHGKGVKLFPGLAGGGWFDRMNKFAREKSIQLDHYIISSGIHEMIMGCPIAKHFRHIFASRYLYAGDEAKWPAVCINYTTKTQYLFRINKGIENSWDDDALNAYMPHKTRPVPFTNMVFFGDGSTDIPTMKMLTYQGGTSVAIYEGTQPGQSKVHSLISDGRVEFTAPADFSESTPLDVVGRGILGRIANRSEA